MNIGEQIKIRRKERGLTMEELAGLCELSSKRVIYDYEVGRKNVSLKVLQKIADALGCELQISLNNKNS